MIITKSVFLTIYNESLDAEFQKLFDEIESSMDKTVSISKKLKEDGDNESVIAHRDDAIANELANTTKLIDRFYFKLRQNKIILQMFLHKILFINLNGSRFFNSFHTLPEFRDNILGGKYE